MDPVREPRPPFLASSGMLRYGICFLHAGASTRTTKRRNIIVAIQFDQLMSTAGASCMLVPPGRFLHYETLSIILVIRFN